MCKCIKWSKRVFLSELGFFLNYLSIVKSYFEWHTFWNACLCNIAMHRPCWNLYTLWIHYDFIVVKQLLSLLAKIKVQIHNEGMSRYRYACTIPIFCTLYLLFFHFLSLILFTSAHFLCKKLTLFYVDGIAVYIGIFCILWIYCSGCKVESVGKCSGSMDHGRIPLVGVMGSERQHRIFR